MKAAFKKRLQGSEKMAPATPLPRNPTLARPSASEILHYRYHHGTNLGSIFVLEKWLYGSMFDANDTGDSELDAVTASIAKRGVERTRERWEAHWARALSDDDLFWLANTAHCTTIRLPVGYFTLGPGFCMGTPYGLQVAQVYVSAWAAVKELVARCLEVGIGVLLDFHAVPGGANGETHSGTGSGEAGLWGSKRNLELAARCLFYMAGEVVGGMAGVVGIQVCNEAAWEAPGLYKFYDTAIAKIAEVDPTLPVYISDAWNLDTAIRYAVRKNSVRGQLSNPVIVDTHRYYTFAEKDKSRSPREIVAQMPSELPEVAQFNGDVFGKKGACDIYVGEYSCTLDQKTWDKAPRDSRSALTREFGQAQSKRWQQATCGSAFWTLSMDWMPGGDWGYKEQVDNGNITGPQNLYLPTVEVIERGRAAEEVRDDCMARAIDGHQKYWHEQAPKTQFNHWRFADGWGLGWTDASDFFLARSRGIFSSTKTTRPQSDEAPLKIKGISHGGDKIGMLDLWVLKRMQEVGCADKQQCSSGWEFEQGFRQGVTAFYIAARI